VPRIPLGDWVNSAVDWLLEHVAWLFDFFKTVFTGTYDGINTVLQAPEPLLLVGIFAVIAFWLRGTVAGPDGAAGPAGARRGGVGPRVGRGAGAGRRAARARPVLRPPRVGPAAAGGRARRRLRVAQRNPTRAAVPAGVDPDPGLSVGARARRAVRRQVEMVGICGTDKHTYAGETKQYAGTPAETDTPFPARIDLSTLGG